MKGSSRVEQLWNSSLIGTEDLTLLSKEIVRGNYPLQAILSSHHSRPKDPLNVAESQVERVSKELFRFRNPSSNSLTCTSSVGAMPGICECSN